MPEYITADIKISNDSVEGNNEENSVKENSDEGN